MLSISEIRKRLFSDKPELLEAIKRLNGENAAVVFDIGAHKGRYSLEINKVLKVERTFCFEPTPANFNVLKRELSSANYFHFDSAISDYTGEAIFYLNSLDETNSLLPSSVTNSSIDKLTSTKDEIKVPVYDLDTFCLKMQIDKIDVLKVDAQGNSLKVLTGGSKLLLEKRIKIIQCEVEFLKIYKDQSLYHDVALYLESFGYSLYSLYNIHYDVNNRISWADAIFI